jgi:hypothetical protein
MEASCNGSIKKERFVVHLIEVCYENVDLSVNST